MPHVSVVNVNETVGAVVASWLEDRGYAAPNEAELGQAVMHAAAMGNKLASADKGWPKDTQPPLIANADVSATVLESDEPVAILTMQDVTGDARVVQVNHDAGWQIAWGLLAFLRMMDRA